MERSVVILAVAVGGAALFGASSPSPATPARAAEVVRLERHFDAVDLELRSRDVSGFTASQKENRAKLVSWLRDYRNAGRFPTNDRFEEPTPFFRDKYGALCAMAYLIDRSGRSDIVDKVAATRNNAYISELADDPSLIAWLDTWGLSVDEAARIQPSYDGGGIIGGGQDEDDHVDSDVAMAAIGLGALSVGSAALNVARPTYFSGFLGVVAGTASILVGANYLDENEGTERVATATIALGAVSLGAGIYGLLEARRDQNRWDDRDRFRDRRRKGYSMKVLPDITFNRSEPKVGLLVSGRF